MELNLCNYLDIITNEQEKYIVTKVWTRFGGSFMQGLGQALSHADFDNTIKIKETWKKEWEEALKNWKEIKNDKHE